VEESKTRDVSMTLLALTSRIKRLLSPSFGVRRENWSELIELCTTRITGQSKHRLGRTKEVSVCFLCNRLRNIFLTISVSLNVNLFDVSEASGQKVKVNSGPCLFSFDTCDTRVEICFVLAGDSTCRREESRERASGV
jgi:hypothetical protein